MGSGGPDLLGEKDTRVSIDVWPWVFGLSSLEQDVGHELVDLSDELEHGIIGEVFERKFSLSSVSRVLYDCQQ